MSATALELNDRALALAAAGELRSVQPAVVFNGSGGEPPGASAWDVQRARPTQVSTRHWADLAAGPEPAPAALALVAAELRVRLAAAAQGGAPPDPSAGPLWLVAPAALDARALGSVLGVVRALAVPVAGFADAPAVAAAALGLDGPVVVLELGLHQVSAAALHGGERVRRRRAAVSRRGGLIELYESWLELIAAAMVKRTRFDPLHEGASEQQLFSALPQLARAAGEQGSARAALETRGERFEVELSRDQFAQAAQPIYRELIRLVHELRPAGARLTLVAPALLGELPGLLGALEQFAGCELVRVPDGFAALAASRLLENTEAAAGGDAVRLVRSLARPGSAVDVPDVQRSVLGGARSAAVRPTHVLFDGRAIALAGTPIEIGRTVPAGGSIVLPEGLAGISRRHCSLRREGEDVMLVDYSRFGTFVNGERVAGRVRLLAGDRVRIGDPGVQLELIAVGG